MAFSCMKTFFQKHRSWSILGVILLVAAVVRLYHIETKMRFIWDEVGTCWRLEKSLPKKI